MTPTEAEAFAADLRFAEAEVGSDWTRMLIGALQVLASIACPITLERVLPCGGLQVRYYTPDEPNSAGGMPCLCSTGVVSRLAA